VTTLEVKQGVGGIDRVDVDATLRTLDLSVPPIPEHRVPAGWVPLIALCGACWTDVVEMLRKQATPDSSGAVSP
jgi:hypothetical protein